MTNKSVTKVCLMRFDHCRDLLRGELSKNQVIFQNIHLRAEICGDTMKVFIPAKLCALSMTFYHKHQLEIQDSCHGEQIVHLPISFTSHNSGLPVLIAKLSAISGLLINFIPQYVCKV